jgi:glycosyltransferase involved in cell wall biosynthesis
VIRVAIDARRLQDRPMTGVGRGLDSLLPYLSEEFDVVLLTDATRHPADTDLRQVPLFGWWGLPEPLWLHGSAWHWLSGFDGVFHGTYNGLPAAYRGPAVVSVYDLSFEHHPEDYSTLRQAVIRATARCSMRRAQVTLTCSEFIRRSIIDTYGFDGSQVVVAPMSAAPVFHPDRRLDAPGVLDRLGVMPPYIVAIGGARRRRLDVAVEAWRRLDRSPNRPALVVVGSERPPLDPGIFHVGRIDDEAWASVLAGSDALLYPTRYEGYGMPAIEAAASGVPVVCAPVGPLPEVLGEAAEWSASTSVEDVHAALRRLFASPARRHELAEAGLVRAASAPGWGEIAKIVGGVYRRAYEEANAP